VAKRSSSVGSGKCMFKNNPELRISFRQTNIRVLYLPTITLVHFEFQRNVQSLISHFSLKMCLLLKYITKFLDYALFMQS